jgi:hypothetical protein
MRENLLNAKETIDCTAILHNFAMLWDDDVPPLDAGEDDHHPAEAVNEDEAEDVNDPDYVIVEDEAPR